MRWITLQRVLGLLFMTTASSAWGEAIDINGTCAVGNCASPGILNVGSSTSLALDYTYVFANSDTYHLAASVGAMAYQNEHQLSLANYVVTYTGNRSGSSSGDDMLTTSLLQDFAPGFPLGTGSFGNQLFGIFGPGLGNASSAAANLYANGVLLNSIGPVYAPPATFNASSSGPAPTTGAAVDQLDDEYQLTFGSGSSIGSSITVYPTNPPASPVPEPSTFALLGTGLLGAARLLKRPRAKVDATRRPGILL